VAYVMSDIGNKEVFAKNLAKYVDASGKSRNEICSELGIAYSTFSEWICGRKYPRIDKIELLANYFGIRKSELIEEQKLASQSRSGTRNNLTFPIRLRELRNNNNFSIQRLSELSGIREELIQMYENMQRLPNLITLGKLANALNVTPDYLYGRDLSKCSIPENDAYIEGVIFESPEVISKLSLLNYLGRKKVENYIDDLLKVSEYKLDDY
jgi:transcriptional regulator with XRE-family HTH domain